MRLLILGFLLLAGCDGRWDQAIQKMADFKDQTVVLTGQPFELDSRGRTFISKQRLDVLGTADTCLVLKTEYPLAPRAQMDRDFDALLRGTRITTTLTATNGQEYEFDDVGQAWNLHGSISSSEELSACISCGCKPKIPVGTVIRSIHIKADKPLPVLGAYWNSMPDLNGPEG